MNILIIDHEPYTPRKRSNYFMDHFRADRIGVEFWSVCNALPYNTQVEFEVKETGENVLYISTYDELLERLRNLDPATLVFLEVWFTWSTLGLFRILKERNIQYVQIDYYLNLVTAFSEFSIGEKLRNEFNPKNALKWAWNLIQTKALYLLSKRTALNKKALLFLTGSFIEQFHPGTPKKSLSYFDLDIFEKAKGHSRLVPEPYIVFLDILLPTHPDLMRMNVNTLPADVYYQKLCAFFDKLERDTGYQVVVASHPKANYSSEFGKRVVLSGKTAELVNDCTFVITHGSLSINFAVLANKPLVYIYSDEFEDSKNYLAVMYQRMKNASTYFHCPIVNIDSYQKEHFSKLSVNHTAYSSYLIQYIYSAEYPLSNYEIVKKSLLELEKRSLEI